MKRSDTDHWASYYRSGALVSCPTNPEPYYTMEVRDAWVRFFRELADGDQILDLGTGNGPVALIARETAAMLSRQYGIDGVDLADIDPHQNVPDGAKLLSGIRFHGGVDIETLPFADRAFDAVSGQYILEYTDSAKSLAECARVLAPGGRCQFILHHLDSVIVRNALSSLGHADLIRETRVIRKFVDYCNRMDVAPGNVANARAALFDVGESLQSEAKESSNPLLLRFVIDFVSDMLANRSQMPAGELLRQTIMLEKELKRWVQRLTDLAKAALSKEEMDALIAHAKDCDFRVTDLSEQMQGGDNLVGWRLTISRPL